MDQTAERLTFLEGRSLFPRFSPDGTKIVFMSSGNHRCDIYSINADGSDLKQLTTAEGHFSGATFSPDGSRIAFLRSDRFYEEIHDIWIMDADGMNQWALTATRYDYEPHFSPDGRWITFMSGRDKSLEIYRMRADGADPKRLTFVEDRPPSQRIGPPPSNRSPRYLADGSGIVFASSYLRPSEKSEHAGKFSIQGRQIHRMNVDGSDQKPLTATVDWCGDPEVSADGSWVAFSKGGATDHNQSLCLVRPDGSGIRILAGSEGDYHAFHPAGGRVIFTSTRDRKVESLSRNGDLYCIRIDNGELERLTDNEDRDTLPAFSPDGKQIVFCSDRDGPTEIYSRVYG